MRLYNTLTRTVEPFEASNDVRMYVCGVTPYATTHLGHARTYLTFDVLLRHLRASGHRVRYVQNVTDVDDSITAKAAELGENWRELGERFTKIFLEDTEALNFVAPDEFPHATDVIGEMQDVIARLLGTGHAYEVDGDVFFRVASAHDFGKLSRLDRYRMEELESTQDGTTIDDPRKEDPLDFLLWRSTPGEEPSWPSPWGPGRPGWHIECSTLATGHLGPTIDIHGGGQDLIFPHHEAEIAQAEAATGQEPFARFWVHVAMAQLDGRKMSKSEGNMVFVRDLLEHHTPDAIRLYLMGTHYRESLDFDEDALRRAGGLAERLARYAGAEDGGADDASAVVGALDEDLDTPLAVAALVDAVDRAAISPAAVRAVATERLGLRLDV